MSSIRLHRPSPALVVATVALITALAGTSYAAFSLPRSSVGSKQLKHGAVTTAAIKNGAVTRPKLNLNGVTVPNALHANAADSASIATSATTAGTATNASNLGGQPAGAYAHAQALGATSAFLENGWTTGSSFGVAGYAKDQFGIVHLFGAVSNASVGTNPIFTLPVGFRPAYNIDAAVAFGINSLGALRINPDGSLSPGTNTNFVELEGVSFAAGG